MTLIISNVSNLVLTGPKVGPGEPPQASIWCNYTVQFRISDSHNVTLQGLNIQGCGVPNPRSSNSDYVTTVSTLPSAVLFDNVHLVAVENVQIRHSHSYGMVVNNCFKRVSISCSYFDRNYWRDLVPRFTQIRPGIGGNMLLYSDTISGEHTVIEVVNSIFSHGRNFFERYRYYSKISSWILLGSGGLNIVFSDADRIHHLFNVSVTNCTFVNNTGKYGGNMNVRLDSSSLVQVNLYIQCSSFVNGTAGKSGGGLYLLTSKNEESSSTIVNSTFIQNVAANDGGGGVYIELYVQHTIKVIASQFSDNEAWSGGGLYVDYFRDKTLKREDGSSLYVLLDSTFNGNTAKSKGGHGYINLHSTYMNPNLLTREVITIRISRCLFQSGHAVWGGALGISGRYNSSTIIDSSLFYQNNASYGGAVYVEHYLRSYTVRLKHSKLIANFAHYGAGICANSPNSIEYMFKTPIFYGPAIHLSGTQIEDNVAAVVSVIYFRGILPASYLIIDTSHICNNTVIHLEYSSAAIYLGKMTNSWIINTNFSNNLGSCIWLSHSNITLHGYVEFLNNTANVGAALLLDCPLESLQPSFLVLFPNTTVTIANNTALYYGGGLAANPVCNYNNSCFFQTPSLISTEINLDDNMALVSANSIYGPPVIQCDSQDGNIDGDAKFLTLFRVVGGYSVEQVVLSAINKVCFCWGDAIRELICNTESEISVWVGKEFMISVIATGPLNDTSRRLIRASLIDVGGSKSEFGNKNQEIQELQRSCDQLIYSVFTFEEKAQIELRIDSVPNAPPSFINIVFRKCPFGFQLDNDQEGCVCSNYLISQIQEITCDIINEVIIIPGRVWVGNYSDRLAVHRHCPLDYCSPETHSVDLQRQHLQCAFNRSGVLCGGCQTGLSLSLGTAHCLDNCSNYYLLLVFPFALAGVAITFILLKCNLNVSVGTVNSVIFYVNIIHVNRTIFFPQSKRLFLTKMLAVFVAWLNLDLGIETCFYSGMTAYVNTWLQFVFPVYIWVLVLVMIYTSRYFAIAYKIIGRNAVSVLATLFLLSYAKLFRTVIVAVSSTNLGDETGRSHLLWLMDGNVPYFSASHAVLFFVALLAVLLYILPFTILTLLAPYLQARTNHRMMRWVVRIKPLLDAYQGPYKDKYRHWTGVMLLLRIVLFVVFSANTLGNPNINVFSISVSTVALHLYQIWVGRLYKTRLNQFLEGFYSGNLCLFAIGILFLNASQGSSEALACVMVGSAFLVFCFVVVWHFNHQTRAISRAGERLKQLWTSRRRRQAEDIQEAPDSPPRQPQPTVSVIDMKELREQEN